MESVNQYQRAALTWNILIAIAKDESFIRYKELGNQIGVHHRAIRFVLAIIQDYCLMNHLPPITILVGNELGIPGSGFTAWDIWNIEDGKNQVYDYNWNLLENPFGYALEGLTEEQVVDALLNKPESSEEVYAKVKVRGTAQTIFRKALLKAYKSRCAICGLSFEFALQAAHIIPWNIATRTQRLDVRNGLLLCATHHCLYDQGYVKINEDYTVLISSLIIHKSQYDNLLTTSLNNRKLLLPVDINLWPALEYIRARN